MLQEPTFLYKPQRHEDHRGWFVESFCQPTFDQMAAVQFVQDNHSYSTERYTLRGLHFQLPPHAQAKLVRCTRGSVFDVAVDLRAGSPTYGRWVAAVLSAKNGWQLFVPEGFAHGFLTLEDHAEVQYKCSNLYAPTADAGLRWNDPDIAIDWPLPSSVEPNLSEKDREQQLLSAFASPFGYDGRPLMPLSKE